MKRFTWLRWTVSLAAVALVVADIGVSLSRSQPHVQVSTLPDGTRLTLLQSEFGLRHALKARSNDFPGMFLPPREVAVTASDTETLGVWLGTQHVGNTKNQQQSSLSQAWDRVELADEQGRTMHLGRNSDYRSTEFSDAENDWSAELFDRFPRRGKQIHLRYFQGKQQVAAFMVPAPVSGSFPEWQAKPLPQIQHVENVTFTLNSLAYKPFVRVYFSGNGCSEMTPADFEAGNFGQKMLRKESFVSLEASLFVNEPGVKQVTWDIESIQLEDPTGNTNTTSHLSRTFPDMASPRFQAQFALQDTFSSGEPVGRLRIRAVRNQFADIPATGQRQYPESIVPAATQILSFPNGLMLGSMKAEVYLLGGNKVQVTQDLDVTSNYPAVLVTLPPDYKGAVPMLRVVDHSGKLLTDIPGDSLSGSATSVGNNQKTSFTSNIQYMESNTPLQTLPHWVRPSHRFTGNAGQSQLLLYPLVHVKSGDKVNLSFANDPMHTLEFYVPMPVHP